MVVEEGPGLVPVPLAAADFLGGLELAVQADVEDDAGSAHGLPVEQAHEVTGIVHVAQISHEPLSIEGPALPVTRRPVIASPRVELVTSSDGR